MAASARSSIIALRNNKKHVAGDCEGGYPMVFGFNKDGLLGLADKNIVRPTTVPYCEIEPIPMVKKVSCGFKHSAFLVSLQSGTNCAVYASGSNKRG